MNDQPNSTNELPNFGQLSKNLAQIAEKSQRIIQDFLIKQARNEDGGLAVPPNIGAPFLEMTIQMMANPTKWFGPQMELWQDYLELWHHATSRAMGLEVEPVIKPEDSDRRFEHSDWDDNQLFAFIKQSYLLTARWTQSLVSRTEGLNEDSARKIDFYTRQFVNAIAPSNFLLTNPEVLRETIESGGENLVCGLQNLLDDLESGKGHLRILQTDPEAFKIGKNIASTPGKIIYQNDLIQLIQYMPTTGKVYKRPLLIIPPWINKYYILDLRKKNSFVRWALDKGHTVFMISWVNPDETHADKTFEDYMCEGPLAAIDAVEQATGEKRLNVTGYCIGGTLLACTLAYLAIKKDFRVHSASFLTTMVDFKDPGELAVFIDEEQLVNLEKKMKRRGYLESHAMTSTFNMLRENDLIWSFVVNNYLLGKTPLPFDLLLWNADSTRIPAKMHSFYLRKMYLENRLSAPGGIVLGGVPIDLRNIQIPTYIVACREDHIAPWKSAYAATQLYTGQSRFILSASGHVSGVVNPPAKNKYSFWASEENPASAEAWLTTAVARDGSWWKDWAKWMMRQGGKKVEARTPGKGTLKSIEDAPGSYAKINSG